MKNYLLIVFSIVALVATGCSGKNDGPPEKRATDSGTAPKGVTPPAASPATVTPIVVPKAKTAAAYPAEIRAEYLQVCVKGASGLGAEMAGNYCKCTLDGFESRFSIEVFKTLTQKASLDEVPAEIREVTEECIKKLSVGSGKKKSKQPGTKLKGSGQFRSGLTSFRKVCEEGAVAKMGAEKAQIACGCALEEIEKAFTVDEFIRAAGELKSGAMPPKIQAIMKQCVQKLGSSTR
jgi:hypothetical protein